MTCLIKQPKYNPWHIFNICIQTKIMAVLTFKYLRELQKSERDSPALQKIDACFYTACSKCLAGDSTDAESIRPLVKSILDTRERKIVTAALQSARADIKLENLLSEEDALFSKMSELLKSNRVLIDNVLSGKIEEPEPVRNAQMPEEAVLESDFIDAYSTQEILKIRAILDIPAFVAENMKSYGPIASGQTAELPKKAAEVLINAKMAEKTE